MIMKTLLACKLQTGNTEKKARAVLLNCSF